MSDHQKPRQKDETSGSRCSWKRRLFEDQNGDAAESWIGYGASCRADTTQMVYNVARKRIRPKENVAYSNQPVGLRTVVPP